MPIVQEVVRLLRDFCCDQDGEAAKSRDLTLALLEWSPEPFSRHTFTPGHITCTGAVLSPDGASVLLVHHRRLDRWLLPGGHVEAEDGAIWRTAFREVVEETGVSLEESPPVLAGVDVHAIPGRGPEPLHLHHDLIFAFRARSDRFTVSEECRDVAWVRPADYDRYRLPGSIRRAAARGFDWL